MGMPKQVIKALLHEDRVRPITGTFGVFGKQTVHVSQEWLDSLDRGLTNLGSEKETRHSPTRDFAIDDKSLVEALFGAKYKIYDRSPYEGADTIVDLNLPLPSNLAGSCDFLYSGGTLDNVFNPAQVLMNASKMLAPGGRIVSYEASQGILGAYLQFTPEWFYSFFAVNGYKRVSVFLLHQEQFGDSRFQYSTTVYQWNPEFTRDSDFNYFEASRTHPGIQYVLCIAEKGDLSSDDQIPVQMQYIDENSLDWRKAVDRETLASFSTLSDLSPDAQPVSGSRKLPFNSTHYKPILQNF